MYVTRVGFRVAFFVATCLAGALFWLAPHPPMVDLPQHAGQVATLHDLLIGQSPWSQLLRINLFTPYLLAYGLATALSFLMPVGGALKLVLTLSFYAYVAAYVALRRRFQADERLDWLCLPGFFGFAYEFGFYSFLVAVPVGMVFMMTALDYAERQSFRSGGKLLLAGVAAFFSHGLVFVLTSAIGGICLISQNLKEWRGILRSASPYVALAALCGMYALLHRDVDLAPMYPFKVIWEVNPLVRLVAAAVYPWGIAYDAWMVPATFVVIGAPYFMGVRWNRHPTAWVPFATIAFVWFCVPFFAMNTFFLFNRFALFLFPFFALNFRRASEGERSRRIDQRRVQSAQLVLAIVCIAFLCTQGLRAIRFAGESSAFDAIAAVVKPEQRALNLVFDKGSPAADNPLLYDNFALWYQAEHRGLVDFNAAWFPPQIVRYRLNRLPAIGPADVATEAFFRNFDWNRHEGWMYRYIFVRHTLPVPDSYFANADCRIVLLKTVQDWSVYETQTCHHR